QRDARTPADLGRDAGNVGGEIAGLDLLGEPRPLDEFDPAAAREIDDGARHVGDAGADAPADVERTAVGARRFAQGRPGGRRILYIDVVALLAPVAIDRQGLARKCQMNHAVNDAVAGPAGRLARSIRVRDPRYREPDAEQLLVEPQIPLHG